MKLYNELMKFKDTATFIKYGFAIAGPHNVWLKKVEKLSEETNKSKYGDLLILGFHYVASKGKETNITKALRNEM